MQIKIKTLTGKVTDHNVEADETVLSLKNSLQEKEVCHWRYVCHSGNSAVCRFHCLLPCRVPFNLTLCGHFSPQGITVDQIKLIYNGKQLADDKTLESYNIEAGKVLHMVLTLRGGK